MPIVNHSSLISQKSYENVQPKLLNALDNLRLGILLKVREDGPNDPVAAKCLLKWILSYHRQFQKFDEIRLREISTVNVALHWKWVQIKENMIQSGAKALNSKHKYRGFVIMLYS